MYKTKEGHFIYYSSFASFTPHALKGQKLLAQAAPWAKSFWAFSPYLNHLELCVLRSTWERNHVTDVLHTCNKENQALETETETSMRT